MRDKARLLDHSFSSLHQIKKKISCIVRAETLLNQRSTHVFSVTLRREAQARNTVFFPLHKLLVKITIASDDRSWELPLPKIWIPSSQLIVAILSFVRNERKFSTHSPEKKNEQSLVPDAQGNNHFRHPPPETSQRDSKQENSAFFYNSSKVKLNFERLISSSRLLSNVNQDTGIK